MQRHPICLLHSAELKETGWTAETSSRTHEAISGELPSHHPAIQNHKQPALNLILANLKPLIKHAPDSSYVKLNHLLQFDQVPCTVCAYQFLETWVPILLRGLSPAVPAATQQCKRELKFLERSVGGCRRSERIQKQNFKPTYSDSKRRVTKHQYARRGRRE